MTADTLSTLQAAPSGTYNITDNFFIRGCLQLRTELHCITGSTSGELYEDFYYDPFYTEWKVTHECIETGFGYDYGMMGYATDYETLHTIGRTDNNGSPYQQGLVYFQPIAYYLIYDCKEWLEEKLKNGFSAKKVKFKFRQVDFSPTLNISMTSRLRTAIWEQTDE